MTRRLPLQEILIRWKGTFRFYITPDGTITILADSRNTADGDTLFVDAALDVPAGSFRLSDKIRGYYSNSDNTATAMPPKFEITGYNSTK